MDLDTDLIQGASSEYVDFGTLPDVSLFTVTRSGELDYVAPDIEGLYGVPVETIKENPTRIAERVPEFDREEIERFFSDLRSSPEETAFTHQVMDENGRSRWVQIRFSPIYDDGEMVRGIGVVLDITDQMRREQELLLLHRLLRHEIRNDIAVIDGWLDVLAERPDDQDEILERISTASGQVLELIEESGESIQTLISGSESDLEPIALRPLLETILAEKRDVYPHAAFDVIGEIPDVSVTANALLSTVFRNLLQNAVVHNDSDQPQITLTVETRPATVCIRIADNGPGISDEMRGKLFQLGQKGARSSGTGMGLYICRQLVTSYGGRIWNEPNEPSGCAFRVELPLAD